MNKPKLKLLSLEEAISVYPHHAYCDIEEGVIVMPDKEALFKLVLGHEYIHWLRRRKLSAKFLASMDMLLLLFVAVAMMSIAYSFMSYLACILLTLFLYSYYVEEIHIQKKLLGEVTKNVEEELSKES